MAWKEIREARTDGYDHWDYKYRKEWVPDPKEESNNKINSSSEFDAGVGLIIVGLIIGGIPILIAKFYTSIFISIISIIIAIWVLFKLTCKRSYRIFSNSNIIHRKLIDIIFILPILIVYSNISSTRYIENKNLLIKALIFDFLVLTILFSIFFSGIANEFIFYIVAFYWVGVIIVIINNKFFIIHNKVTNITKVTRKQNIFRTICVILFIGFIYTFAYTELNLYFLIDMFDIRIIDYPTGLILLMAIFLLITSYLILCDIIEQKIILKNQEESFWKTRMIWYFIYLSPFLIYYLTPYIQIYIYDYLITIGNDIIRYLIK